jgi:hypothetical protein
MELFSIRIQRTFQLVSTGYQYPKTLFDIMSTDYTIQIYYVLLDSTNIQILFRMS